MKSIVIAAAFLTVAMCSYYYKIREDVQQSKAENKETCFVQLMCSCPGITKLREALPRVVNEILQQELSSENPESLFLKKDRLPLSVYYLNGMETQGEDVVVKALENAEKDLPFKAPQNLVISPAVNFFGEWNDELVIMIDDVDKQLMGLNVLVKALMHSANEAYSKIHGGPLFDIAKSERFPFVPHIGLGRLRSNSIKQQVKDQSRADEVLERIKSRVRDATLKLLAEIVSQNDKTITCGKLVLFSLTKRAMLKEFLL